MTESLANHWSSRTVLIRGEEIPVWPEAQEIRKLEDSVVLMTHFADAPQYHPELIRKTLEMKSASRYTAEYSLGGCGNKVYHLDRWQPAEAELINLRALAFFSIMFDCMEPVEMCPWPIFQNGRLLHTAQPHPDPCLPGVQRLVWRSGS